MTATPTLATTREELADALRTHAGPRVLVPTMGALHAGHASLLRAARGAVGPSGPVVASIFVNPTQFAPGEDLAGYPRSLEADLELCAYEGVDVVFTPSVDTVYPYDGPAVGIDPGPLAVLLEGTSRPTHFRGVLSVVAKLLGLVRPDVAVFGEKDYQQLVLVRRLATDLCLGVEVLGAPTVREPDGLALSSRNRNLGPAERRAAVTLSRALFAGRDAAYLGPDAALDAAGSELERVEEAGVEVDYLTLTAPDLGIAPEAGEARMLVAARVGSTRLIDNVALRLGEH